MMVESLAAFFKVITLVTEFTSTFKGPGRLGGGGNSNFSQKTSLAVAWCDLLQSLHSGGGIAAGR